MGLHVLVVDDNPSDQMIAKSFLQNQEMKATVVSNGFEALNLLTEEDQDFDILVVDLQMPQMPGIELLKRIRRMESHRETPILIMSARNEMKDVKLAIDHGAGDYSVKPLDGMVFIQKVRKLAKSGSDQWAEYVLEDDVDDVKSKIQIPTKLISISELRATIRSPFPLEKGETTQFDAGLFSSLELVGPIMGKVGECQKIDSMHVIKVDFMGLNERDAKKIRQFCKKGWARQTEEKRYGKPKKKEPESA